MNPQLPNLKDKNPKKMFGPMGSEDVVAFLYESVPPWSGLGLIDYRYVLAIADRRVKDISPICHLGALAICKRHFVAMHVRPQRQARKLWAAQRS